MVKYEDFSNKNMWFSKHCSDGKVTYSMSADDSNWKYVSNDLIIWEKVKKKNK